MTVNITENIRETKLADALSERYLAYAVSTIVARSLPDVRDGLKPVHRRVLVAREHIKVFARTAVKKCSTFVGAGIFK